MVLDAVLSAGLFRWLVDFQRSQELTCGVSAFLFRGVS